jgi:Rrf2 family protein
MRLGRASAYGMIAMMDIAKASPRSSTAHKNGKSNPSHHRNGGGGNGHEHAHATAMAIAKRSQSRARQIAEDTGIPVEYLRKVLQRLTRARLVQSERGRGGGFRLGKSPDKITLLQIVEAIEGPVDEMAFVGDGLLRGRLREETVGLRRWRRHVSAGLRDLLSDTTLANLMES